MSEIRDERVAIDSPADQSAGTEREWRSPTLTVLGDADTLTEFLVTGGDGTSGS
jgi:hypothetical protein